MKPSDDVCRLPSFCSMATHGLLSIPTYTLNEVNNICFFFFNMCFYLRGSNTSIPNSSTGRSTLQVKHSETDIDGSCCHQVQQVTYPPNPSEMTEMAMFKRELYGKMMMKRWMEWGSPLCLE